VGLEQRRQMGVGRVHPCRVDPDVGQREPAAGVRQREATVKATAAPCRGKRPGNGRRGNGGRLARGGPRARTSEAAASAAARARARRQPPPGSGRTAAAHKARSPQKQGGIWKPAGRINQEPPGEARPPPPAGARSKAVNAPPDPPLPAGKGGPISTTVRRLPRRGGGTRSCAGRALSPGYGNRAGAEARRPARAAAAQARRPQGASGRRRVCSADEPPGVARRGVRGIRRKSAPQWRRRPGAACQRPGRPAAQRPPSAGARWA